METIKIEYGGHKTEGVEFGRLREGVRKRVCSPSKAYTSILVLKMTNIYECLQTNRSSLSLPTG